MTEARSRQGKNPMAGTWTKAAKVRRAFKAGRPLQKDRVLSTNAAIYEACILLDSLRTAMGAAELPVEDVRACLVLVTPEAPDLENVVFVVPIPEPNKLPELFANVAKVAKVGAVLPLGIAVWQKDRDPKAPSGAVAWVQPFLTGPRAESALRKARQIVAEGKGKEGKSTFN